MLLVDDELLSLLCCFELILPDLQSLLDEAFQCRWFHCFPLADEHLFDSEVVPGRHRSVRLLFISHMLLVVLPVLLLSLLCLGNCKEEDG